MAKSQGRCHLCAMEKTIPPMKDWESEHDPNDPHNWPRWYKTYITATIAGISLVCTFASSTLSAGLDDLATDLNTSSELARLAFSIYVLGLGLGAIFAAPCSETFGRRAVYWTACPTFALFVLGTGLSNSIEALIITRFFAGLFAAPGVSVGAGTLADIWYPKDRAGPLSIFIGTAFLGPTLGPLLGGFVVEAKNWRWTSWIVLFAFVLAFTPALFLRETYKRVILYRRARNAGVAGPPSPVQDGTFGQALQYFLQTALARPLYMLFTEPVVAALATWIAFIFAVLYAFFAAFPYVYNEYYGFSVQSTGLTYIGLGVGLLLGFLYLTYPDRMIYKRVASREKQKDPSATGPRAEHQLYAAMLGGILMPPSLFIFGWTVEYRVHWIVPVLSEVLFGAGIYLVFMSAIKYIVNFYGPLYGASANAASVLTRYSIGFALPLFAVQMYSALGVGWASSLLGFISTLMATIPFVLFKFGPALRARSNYK